MEETGAVEFSIECVSTYSVNQNKEITYGRLYLAYVSRLGQIPDKSEIEEVKKIAGLPDNLTYQLIQPLLYEKVVSFLKRRKDI